MNEGLGAPDNSLSFVAGCILGPSLLTERQVNELTAACQPELFSSCFEFNNLARDTTDRGLPRWWGAEQMSPAGFQESWAEQLHLPVCMRGGEAGAGEHWRRAWGCC
jgi:hypothetical protein